MPKITAIILLFILSSSAICCTIGVVNGSATVDGRPFIWKSREAGINVQMLYEDSYPYKYIGSGNSGSEYVWMGMNETGLAIANAMVGDLDRLPGNGDCMLQALRYYSTIDEFLAFLDSTNVTGRETHTNYVMMDATGAAVVLEVGSTEYWVFDTAESEFGFLTRGNASVTGSGQQALNPLLEEVMTDFALSGEICYEDLFNTLLCGFYDYEYNLLEVPFEGRWNDDTSKPYGYINANTGNSGLSFKTVSLMHGVLPDEPSYLGTMWTMLGNPVCSIALPYWTVCPSIPAPATGDPNVPLNDRAAQIKELIYNIDTTGLTYYADSFLLSNEEENGYWDTIRPFQNEKFELVNSLRDVWQENPPSINVMQSYENDICNEGYNLVMNWQTDYNVQADFEADVCHGEIPLIVHFEDKSRHNPTSIAWDLDGDADIDSIMTVNFGQGVDWIYEEAGHYTVTLCAYKDNFMSTLSIENYITASYPNTDYLEASADTIICDTEEPFYEDFYLYNCGDYQTVLQNFYFTFMTEYPSPQEYIFDWYFTDENLELPYVLATGDSVQIRICPVMPVRDYWGNIFVIEADLDTLQIPCLYDENLWVNSDNYEVPDAQYSLSNHPNPFNPHTEISFYLPKTGYTQISVYNLKGQKVNTIINEILHKGVHSVNWYGRSDKNASCSSGIYFIELQFDGIPQLITKCLLLK